MVEVALSTVLLVVLLVVFIRRRRAHPERRAVTGLFLIALLAAVVPVLARLLALRGTALHALTAAPFFAYVLYGAYWLIRNRREVVAAWKAETEDDRRRGLR